MRSTSRRGGRWRLLRRVPLRARVVAAFTLGATVASVVLVFATYTLARNEMLQQRQSSSTTQFFNNARQAQASLRAEQPDFNVLLESLPSHAGSRSILRSGDTWFAPALTPSDLPPEIVAATSNGSDAAVMRFRNAEGAPELGLGLRLRPSEVSRIEEVAYFEVVPMSDIAETLSTLGLILGGGALATVLIGLSIGVWASRRFLRPLGNLADAATRISEGHFDTRVDESDDPDLAPIVQSFNDMATSLQRRVARDARFASEVSHELRSPLQTLRSSVETLQNRRGELSERSQSALDLLADDVNRFEQMVQDMLVLAQSDAEIAGPRPEPVNLANLARETVDRLNLNVPLELPDDRNDTVVLGDRRRLAQVLDNLLRNAQKHAGGATQLSVERVDNGAAARSDAETFVRVVVADMGPGVTPAERDTIFERFSRGAAGRQAGDRTGAGLGLALVEEHVRSHRGRVRVEGRADGLSGARFVVELPTRGPTAGR